MELLSTLTLIYAAVLVIALAASLIAILIYLRRIAATLSEAYEALAIVSKASEPLANHLQTVQDASTGAAQEVARAQAQLDEANDQLTVLLKRLSVNERVG